MWATIKAGVVKGFNQGWAALQWLLRGLFGEMHWQLPPWMRWLATQSARLATLVKRKPKASAAIGLGLALLIGGGLFGYHWYSHLPKQVYPQCEITAPGLTTYTDDKQKIQPLMVKCNESVAPLEAVGKAVSKGLSLSPKIAGQWLWESDRKLVFSPAAD